MPSIAKPEPMTDQDVDPSASQPSSDDAAALRAQLEELRQRNAELEQPKAKPHRAGRIVRTVAVVVLVCLGAILATAAVPSIWARNLVLNTDRYVQTLQPLASNPGVQNAVVKAVDEQFAKNVDVAGIVNETLPPRAAATLAGPLQAGAASLVNNVATKFVESQQFQTLWDTVNRAAHTALVALLTGQHSENAALAVKNGILYLDLGAVITQVKARLVSAGLAIADKVPAVGVTIELLELKGLSHAQSMVRTLNSAAIWLPILALLCFAGAIAVSRRRRRTTIVSALSLAGGMAVLAIGLIIGRWIYLDNLPLRYLTRDAAGTVFDTLVRYLRDGLRIVFVVALLICFVAWLTSGTDRARSFRGLFPRATRAIAAHAGDSRTARAIAANRRGVVIGLVALALLILVLWTNPGLLTVIVIAGITAALIGVVYSMSNMSRTTPAGR
jgi:hypothetical protein